MQESAPVKKKRRLKKKYRRALQLIAGLILLFVAGSLIEKGISRRPGKANAKTPDETFVPVISHHRIKGVPSNTREFDDSNQVQLAAAEKFGIAPVQNRSEADSLKDRLVEIKDCAFYTVDELKHSIPFLTFGAKEVLDRIGVNFRDSLYAKGRMPHSLIITSILRTKDDVAVLRRRNVNASENSTHCYATTFDITYARFGDSPFPKPAGLQETEPWEMKKILAEVLRDLRNDGSCYVKYEFKQPCFHITARR